MSELVILVMIEHLNYQEQKSLENVMFIYANVGQNNVISMPIYIREKSLVSKQFMRTSSKNIAVFIFISWFTKKPLYFGVVIFWIGRKNFIMKK